MHDATPADWECGRFAAPPAQLKKRIQQPFKLAAEPDLNDAKQAVDIGQRKPAAAGDQRRSGERTGRQAA